MTTLSKSLKWKEIYPLSAVEIQERLKQLKLEIFQVRMDSQFNQLRDTAFFWRSRKELARLNTRLTQLESQAAK